MILAVTMIAALLLISPVLGGNPGSDGGSSSSSSSSSGSASATGSGDNTYSSTVSSGTWTSKGDGWNRYEFRNSQSPITMIAVTPATNSTSRDQLPLTYDISVMSEINTNKLINNMQDTPGQDAVTAKGPAKDGKASSGDSPVYQGLANTAAKNPLYKTSAFYFKNQLNSKDSPEIGVGAAYSFTPGMFQKLQYNYAFHTDISSKQDYQDHPITLQSHKIKAAVGYRF